MAAPTKKKRRLVALKATISIQGMPEVLAVYRRELAEILREAAADASPEAAREMRAVAALFEAGQRLE